MRPSPHVLAGIRLFLAAALLLAGCALNVRRIEGPTLGENTFAGLDAVLADRSVSVLSVLVVHGFGTHRPGYSDDLQSRLTEGLHARGGCKRDHPIHGGDHGSIRVCEYRDAHGERLRVYELVWSPLTEKLKEDYLGVDRRGRDRLIGDRVLKNELLNDRFADAVLYLGGEFKTAMQNPIRYALCFMLNDPLTARALEMPVDPVHACAPFLEEGAVLRLPRDRAFAIVTQSLGSTMVWETLVQMHEDGQAGPNVPFRAIAEEILGRTRMVFMLANQLPLLRLGSVDRPLPPGTMTESTRARPSAFPPKLKGVVGQARTKAEEPKPIQVVAITDPNDLLGYAIPHHLVEDARPYLAVTNVSVSIAKRGFLFVDPLKAHTGHLDDTDVLTMVVCGEPARCRTK